MTTPLYLRPLWLCALSLLVLAMTATARAETVLDNLGEPNFTTATGGELIGAAIQIGATPIRISTVEFHQFFTGGYVFRPGQTFAVYSRNADGTLGTPLFTDFTLVHGGQSLITKAVANSGYVLQANTGYWLVLAVPPNEEFVLWNFTPASTYTSALGVTIPENRASFYREDGKDNYFALAEGPQELRVTAFSATAPAPVPQRIVSRKTHGGAGTFDLELPLSGGGVECRSGGASMDHQIVFFFPAAVTFQSAAVTVGTGSVTSATLTRSKSEGAETQITVNLTGVADVQRLTVTLFGVSDGAGTGNVTLRMGTLIGDTTGNGAVTSSDVGEAKSKSGQAVGLETFKADVTANGTITASDLAQVKSQSGVSLPAAREGSVASER